MKKRTIELSIFIGKLSLIEFYYEHYKYSYEEIAYIVDSKAEVIELYYKRLIEKNEVE